MENTIKILEIIRTAEDQIKDLTGEDVSLQMIFKSKDIILDVGIIIIWVSEALEISKDVILKRTNERESTEPRFIVYDLAKKHLKISLKSIGKQCGGFNHSTVINGIRQTSNWLLTDVNFKSKYNKSIDYVEDKLKSLTDGKNETEI